MNNELKVVWLIVILSIGNSIVWADSIQPQFGLPVNCEMGKECFIQNYVDHDAGPGYKDFRCGHLSYDGHKGTDFRVKTRAQMQLGVPVLAAASGKVIGVRDGEPDVAVSIRGKESLAGKDAGNGVVIDHGNGWRTQYSHLRQGSVKVLMGQIVKKGLALGMIGESGNADFPHVDFAVRYHDRVVDPFRPQDLDACFGGDTPNTLWDTPTSALLRYQPTGILAFGFSTAVPSRLEVDNGIRITPLYIDDPALVFWVELFGADHGDRWFLDITDPSGKKLVQSHEMQEGDKAVAIFAAGIKTSHSLLDPGLYRAQFRLMRGNQVIIDQGAQIQVNVR